MKAMDNGQLVRRSDVALERVGREAVLHDGTSGRVHVINGAAARIWELCDGSRTEEQVADAFAASFGVTRDVVAEDVAVLTAQFRSLGILA